jgi:hypothetical protein
MTSEQRDKIHNLQQAQWFIEKALQSIHLALGDSDVGNEYDGILTGMLEDLEEDLISLSDTDTK